MSYIIDARPEVKYDTEELQKIAGLMSIDEIHLFNKIGTVYGGTVPEYYGYSFNSGEQIEYFKPMLENKNLTMCQDVTPNTSEGKSMMYAITWNEAGKVYKNTYAMMHQIMAETTIEAYHEQADRFANLHTVAERMNWRSCRQDTGLVPCFFYFDGF